MVNCCEPRAYRLQERRLRRTAILGSFRVLEDEDLVEKNLF